MVTFANAILEPNQTWGVVVVIEGVGTWQSTSAVSASAPDTGGADLYCYSKPTFVAVTAPVFPTIASEVDLLSERADLFAGFPELSSVTVDLLDHDNRLTTLVRTDAGPVTKLQAAVDASTTTIPLRSTYNVTAGSVLYVGREAMFVDTVSVVGLNQNVTVRRGMLDTDAHAHAQDDPASLYLPNLRGRKLVVYLVPDNADDWTHTRTYTYVVDGLSWDDTLNVWRIQGRGFLKYLDRVIPRKPAIFTVPDYQSWTRVPQSQAVSRPLWSTDTKRLLHARSMDSDEVFSLGYSSSAYSYTWPRPYVRALLGTSATVEFSDDDTFRQVMLAGHDFRFSPGPTPSTSRSSGTWVKTSNPIHLILCMLTSSADPSDGLELVNYPSGGNNYSSLPSGYGVGIPHALIDWPSFTDAASRFAAVQLPNFALGVEDAKAFSEFVTETILVPLGIYITTRNDKVSIRIPRIPLARDSIATINADTVLVDDSNAPRWSLRRNFDLQPGAVTYLLGPRKNAVSFQTASFTSIAARSPGWYEDEDRPIEIQVPSASEDDIVTFGRMAFRRLLRTVNPLIMVTLDVAFRHLDLNVGDVVSVDLATLPDLALGLRGWTGAFLEINSIEPKLPTDAGPYLTIAGFVYLTRQRAHVVAPSAIVRAIGTDGFGRQELTFDSNAFTSTDSPPPLPTRDATSFLFLSPVMAWQPNFTSMRDGGSSRTVVAQTLTRISLSGPIAGITVGDIITPRLYPGNSIYAYFADGTAGLIDISDASPANWNGAPDIWGED